MRYEDKIIRCENCGQDFPWTASEQEFYAEKDLSAPKRCMICRSTAQSAEEDKNRGTVLVD
jgi:ssDNA-binding Zn-finger/Zn-ribbon topoisomerase 1